MVGGCLHACKPAEQAGVDTAAAYLLLVQHGTCALEHCCRHNLLGAAAAAALARNSAGCRRLALTLLLLLHRRR